MIIVKFACGHSISVSDNTGWQPVCVVCKEPRIARIQSRAPRFTGTVTGPYAEYKAFDGAVVNVAPGGPLHLKEEN